MIVCPPARKACTGSLSKLRDLGRDGGRDQERQRRPHLFAIGRALDIQSLLLRGDGESAVEQRAVGDADLRAGDLQLVHHRHHRRLAVFRGA